ncbi:hypothetical protein [Streptomyces sp. A1136]|uniref:hypothetical protein n=1 Tax=Streptomyces sp. A1136 TaxID=2563102 RepID=UPI00109E74AE|nr:hypothetical protein [Streptomyces sp. A1136]THA44131.1 hypothetical protein E6R62_37225 [Streptomyces sp. A1136]
MANEARRALLVLYRRPDAGRGEAWALDQLGGAEVTYAAELDARAARHPHPTEGTEHHEH